MSIDDTLKERGKTHGDWSKQSWLSRELKSCVGAYYKGGKPEQIEALEMICIKMARICEGNPNNKDHWKDIQGYARLAEMSCDKD